MFARVYLILGTFILKKKHKLNALAPFLRVLRHCTEPEFLDVSGTKVVRVFLLAISNHNHIITPPPPDQSGLKLVFNLNIVCGNLKSVFSQDYAHKLQRNCTSWIRLLFTTAVQEKKQIKKQSPEMFLWSFHPINTAIVGGRGAG